MSHVLVIFTQFCFKNTLILGLARNVKSEIDNMYQGYWQTTLGIELKGKILGLIGLGKVGSQVAKIGKAFGMEVMAWSPDIRVAHNRFAAGVVVFGNTDGFPNVFFRNAQLFFNAKLNG